MAIQYTNLPVDKKVKYELIPLCKKEFLNHHPELRHTKITYTKMLYEICKFYLKGSEFEVKE